MSSQDNTPDAHPPKDQATSSHDRRHPCIPCQKRKVKCDRNEPCLNCSKTGKECISPSTLPARRRKKRFPEAELLARLRRYEDHLRRYGADIDAINNEMTLPLRASSRDTSTATLHEPTRSYSIVKSLRGVESNVWNGVNVEFRDAEEFLRGSSDDEDYSSPITQTYDAICGDGPDFPFMTPTSQSLLEFHPSTVDIFRLWQTFLDNVNPITRIFHAPTIQQKVLEATTDLENVEKNTEALMFGIYSISVSSLTVEECRNMFGEAKSSLLARYQAACRHALLRAGLLRSSDLMTLQAYVLFLISSFNFTIDPRSLFCLLGIAVRIAQRMGLNFDGTTFGLLPFEIEMRRRLWWQLILLDFRVSELSGAGSSALGHNWTTKVPLNINDSDLYPDMKEPPAEYPGVTEMMYVIMRCEIVELMHNLRTSPISLSEKDQAIDELKESLESKYSRYADPSIPLHLITMLMERGLICKMHMGPRHPHLISFTTVSPAEGQKLFDLALEMIESYNLLIKSPKLERFLWHVMTNFPLPGYLFLLCSLRSRKPDALTDRAWLSIEEGWTGREKMKDGIAFWKRKDNALHLAMGNMLIKAWEPRFQARPDIPTPKFIQEMMELVKSKKGKSSSKKETPEDSVPPTGSSEFQDFDFNQGFDDPMMGMMGADPNMGWEYWTADMMQMPLDIPPVVNADSTHNGF